ncbi:MAG TPA: hypothetical protein VNM92_11840 [Thermoanaerobaculia bacterium]|nr:hypothetical protein [Thermoanaerobaculia bacterium]
MSSRALRLLTVVVLLSSHSASAADLTSPMKIVEEIRGLTFSAPVKQETMSRIALRGYLEEQIGIGTGMPPQEYVAVLRALYLIDDAPRPLESLLDLYEAQVLAFYDPAVHTFFSLSEPPAGVPMNQTLEEAVVIHELTHALQDQRFEAGARIEKVKKEWDGSLAYLALLEGEATAVMLSRLASAGGASLDMLLRSQELIDGLASAASASVGVAADAPPYFVASLKFPYLEGIRFVIEAYRRGGWKLVDEIHARPPTTTREILHPATYFQPSPPLLSSNGDRRAAGSATSKMRALSLGEFHWRFLLGADAARGWRWDEVRLMATGAGRKNVLVLSEWDSEHDASEFHTAYVKLLRAKGATVESSVRATRVRLAYGRSRREVRRLFQSGDPR